MAPTRTRTTPVKPRVLTASKRCTPSSREIRSDRKETVGVYLRLRPVISDEPTLVKIDNQQVKTIPPDGSAPQIFSFTQVFDDAPQEEIFDKVARPVVEEFITNGKDGLIFTYGITGSGKTHTMEGMPKDPGLVSRTIDFIFNSIRVQQTQKFIIESDRNNKYYVADHYYPSLARTETQPLPSLVKWRDRPKDSEAKVQVDINRRYCVFISLIELYNKQVHDLFEDFDLHSIDREKKRREIRTDQDGISFVAHAVEIEVKSADEAVEFYQRGVMRRRTGATDLNQKSSRGHCVLNLKLVQVDTLSDGELDKRSLITSQLCLVDLAGSERTKRSGATGGALQEAGNINNSLGALRKCIRALRDREPTSNIQYREYSLTRLFKSYFEGHGSVRMVLCVKPTVEDYQENNIAMDFGLLTQHVTVDYASPPKMLKRSASRAQDANYAAIYELLNKKICYEEPSVDLPDEMYIASWIDRIKSNRDRRKKYMEAAHGAQMEVRKSILTTVNENEGLKQKYETRVKDIRNRDEQMKVLKSELGSTERFREDLERRIENLEQENSNKRRQIDQLLRELNERDAVHAQDEKLRRGVAALIETEEDRSEIRKRLMQLLKRMKTSDWTGPMPSAPKMEPMHTSSPVQIPSSSTVGSSESTSPPATSNSSTEVMDCHDHSPRSHSAAKPTLSSPNSGVPVINPRHNRSLSCSSMPWIHHRPQGTIDTGTVMKPKFKNGRSVRNLRSSDILRKDAACYSVVHQDADPNGDVETSVYKGHIISTVCGGAQVILNDIETMRQASPKRKRAASDAQFTHE